MKYKEIFKTWWFWLIFAIFILFDFAQAIILYPLELYTNLFVLIDVILAAFIHTIIFTAIGFGIYKAFHRNRK